MRRFPAERGALMPCLRIRTRRNRRGLDVVFDLAEMEIDPSRQAGRQSAHMSASGPKRRTDGRTYPNSSRLPFAAYTVVQFARAGSSAHSQNARRHARPKISSRSGALFRIHCAGGTPRRVRVSSTLAGSPLLLLPLPLPLPAPLLFRLPLRNSVGDGAGLSLPRLISNSVIERPCCWGRD